MPSSTTETPSAYRSETGPVEQGSRLPRQPRPHPDPHHSRHRPPAGWPDDPTPLDEGRERGPHECLPPRSQTRPLPPRCVLRTSVVAHRAESEVARDRSGTGRHGPGDRRARTQGPTVRLTSRLPAHRPEEAAPALLCVHGGGVVFGAPEQDDRTNIAFARELGITVAAVRYRLRPDH
ncbi:alpha/beta hydrolase [Streptomyces qaidamensis]|uniref:alpha/beta hydrolase n=1 Tax=Streptomyces qaidamensis TaxID=1783515 RepID=UPI0036EBF417